MENNHEFFFVEKLRIYHLKDSKEISNGGRLNGMLLLNLLSRIFISKFEEGKVLNYKNHRKLQ